MTLLSDIRKYILISRARPAIFIVFMSLESRSRQDARFDFCSEIEWSHLLYWVGMHEPEPGWGNADSTLRLAWPDCYVHELSQQGLLPVLRQLISRRHVLLWWIE